MPYTKFIKLSLKSAMVLAMTAISTNATAAPAKCGERAGLVSFLKSKYKEARVGFGLSQKSTEAFEIFTSESGSWTVIMTLSSGQTCIMATGHSWVEVEGKIKGPVT